MKQRRQQTTTGRPYPSFRRDDLCLCGCKQIVKGRKLLFSAACRKRYERDRIKAEKYIGPHWVKSQLPAYRASLRTLLELKEIDDTEYRRRYIAIEHQPN